MIKQMTLTEFLQFLSAASGDEVIEIISKFQCGGLMVENMTADDFENG